jgi:hypothetical protein
MMIPLGLLFAIAIVAGQQEQQERCPGVRVTQFNSSVSQFTWSSSDGHAQAATSGRHIYDLWLSSNDGAEWTFASTRMPHLFDVGEPNLGRAGVRQVHVSASNPSEFYVSTWTWYMYHTTDAGLSFDRFATLNSATMTPIYVDGITLNAVNASVMLGSTFVIQSAGISYAALCVSFDGGRVWTIVEDRVGQYGWLDSSFPSATNYSVLYLSFPSDPTLRKNGLLLSVTHDTFQSAPIDLLGNVIEIVAATDRRLLVARYRDSLRYDDLSLVQSDDGGASWTHVHMPDTLDNSTIQSRFGVVEHESGFTLLKRHVGDATWRAQLLRGRRLDSEFRIALDGIRSVIRRPGLARIHSVDAVFIAEHFDEEDGGLRSLISFDGAVSWERLERNLSLFVQDYYPDCQTLQCGDLISRSDAPGIATGVGTHGNLTWQLSGLPVPLETYSTLDAGRSWTKVLPFSTVQAISAHANTIVFARNRAPTNELHFSHDFGVTVQSCRLFDTNVTAVNIEASPRGLRQFAVFADDGTFAFVDFDAPAAGPRVRDCAAEDFEPVRIYDGCVLGSRTTMWRRRRDANCVERGNVAPPVQRMPCPCQRSDFECDECFNASSTGDACEPDWNCLEKFRGIDRTTNAPLFCDGEFQQSRGYARLVNNVCIDNMNRFDPVTLQCPTAAPATEISVTADDSASNATGTSTPTQAPQNGCCESHGKGGCNVRPVAMCVCRIDPTCCTQEWDSSCASVAVARCRAQCHVPTLRPKMAPKRIAPSPALSDGAIAGIVIGSIAAVVLLGVVLWCVIRRRCLTRGYTQHNGD